MKITKNFEKPTMMNYLDYFKHSQPRQKLYPLLREVRHATDKKGLGC